MSGLIATRAQLREYLERARGKRHRLNASKILLIHASFITHLKESIREEIIQEGRRETKWADYTKGNGRRVAAKNFFHLLIAASKHEVEVRQLQPMDDITVTLCDS